MKRVRSINLLKWGLTPLLLAMMFGSSFSARAATIFSDSFSNGNIYHSDSINGFWGHKSSNGGTWSGITEPTSGVNAGKLVITNGGKNSSTGMYSWIQSDPLSMFDFFDQPLTFSVDMNISASLDGTPGHVDVSDARFQILSDTQSYNNSDSAIDLRINGGDHIELVGKEGGSSVTFLSNTILSGAVTHVTLTLGPSQYHLAVNYVGDGGTPFIDSGTLGGFTKANWGDGSGNAVVSLLGNRGKGSTKGVKAVTTFDNLTVSTVPVPEPASLSLCLVGLGLLVGTPCGRRLSIFRFGR